MISPGLRATRRRELEAVKAKLEEGIAAAEARLEQDFPADDLIAVVDSSGALILAPMYAALGTVLAALVQLETSP